MEQRWLLSGFFTRYLTVCEDVFLVWPLCCRASESQTVSHGPSVPEELNTWPGAATRCFPRDTSVPSAAALSRGQGADCGLLGSWTATLGLERCACFHLGSGCFSNSLYKSQHLSLKLFNVPELARDAATLCCL